MTLGLLDPGSAGGHARRIGQGDGDEDDQGEGEDLEPVHAVTRSQVRIA